jgi:hypothetical protein
LTTSSLFPMCRFSRSFSPSRMMTLLSSPGHLSTISQIVSTYVGGGALSGKADVDGEFVNRALLGMRRFSKVGVTMRCFVTLFRAFGALSSSSPVRLFQSSRTLLSLQVHSPDRFCPAPGNIALRLFISLLSSTPALARRIRTAYILVELHFALCIIWHVPRSV